MTDVAAGAAGIMAEIRKTRKMQKSHNKTRALALKYAMDYKSAGASAGYGFLGVDDVTQIAEKFERWMLRDDEKE